MAISVIEFDTGFENPRFFLSLDYGIVGMPMIPQEVEDSKIRGLLEQIPQKSK